MTDLFCQDPLFCPQGKGQRCCCKKKKQNTSLTGACSLNWSAWSNKCCHRWEYDLFCKQMLINTCVDSCEVCHPWHRLLSPTFVEANFTFTSSSDENYISSLVNIAHMVFTCFNISHQTAVNMLVLWSTNDFLQKLNYNVLISNFSSPCSLQGVYIIPILKVKGEATFKCIDLQMTLCHSLKFSYGRSVAQIRNSQFFNFQVVRIEEDLKSQTILSYTKWKEENLTTTIKVYDFDKGHVGP